jgi:hypothetical protein
MMIDRRCFPNPVVWIPGGAQPQARPRGVQSPTVGGAIISGSRLACSMYFPGWLPATSFDVDLLKAFGLDLEFQLVKATAQDEAWLQRPRLRER